MFLASFRVARAEDLPPLVKGLQGAAAVAVTREGKVCVALRESGAGSIVVIEKDGAKPLATGLGSPQAMRRKHKHCSWRSRNALSKSIAPARWKFSLMRTHFRPR